MKRVLCVSYPRSGHHATVDALCKYFSGNLNFTPASAPHSEGKDDFGERTGRGGPWPSRIAAGPFIYCNTYSGCNTIPCPDPTVRMQKSHGGDQGIDDALPRFDGVVMLIRHPVEVAVSHYKFARRFTTDDGKRCNHAGVVVEHNRAAWEAFAPAEVDRWRAWVQQWRHRVGHLLGKHNPRVCRVVYADLIASPVDELARVVEFLTDEPADRDLLADVAEAQAIGRKHHVEQFEFFDAGYFDRLAARAAEQIETLELNRQTVGTAELDQAMTQADTDAGVDREPVVLWRRNRTAWRLTWIESGVQLTTCGDVEIAAVLRRLNDRADGYPADRHVTEAIERQHRIDNQASAIPITPRACGPLPEAKA